MAENLGDAVLELRTDDAAFNRGIDAAQRKARQLGKTFDNVGRKAQQIGRQLATFVTLPIIAIGVASVKTASDVQEMQNLFRETFQSASDDVEQWAAVTARAVNRSRFELQRTAADFAAFLKPLGVAPDAIAPMSKALTQLTTDIASFRNQTDEEVFTRLFSGLAGETEAVRRLGIDIGQAAVEAELLALGINKNATEATQAEKVMARFSLIMRQTSDAQGDAVRTSGSFENQTKALAATVTDVRVEIGQRLLPVATRMIQVVRDLGLRFLNLSEDVKSGVIAVGLIVAVVGPAILAFGLLLRAIGFAIAGLAAFGPVLRATFVVIKGFFIAVQVVIVGFTAFFATLPGLIITSLAAIIGSVFIFKETIIGFFKGLIVALQKEFVAKFNNLVVIPFQKLVNALSLEGLLGIQAVRVNDVIDSSFRDDMSRVIADALETGKQEFNEFKDSAIAVFNIVAAKASDLGGAISDFIPDIDLADLSLENLGKQFDDLVAQLGVMNNAFASAGRAGTDAGDSINEAWKNFNTTIRDTLDQNLTDALTSIRSFGDAARAILSDVLRAIIRLGVVRPILGFLGLPSFAHGGRPPVGSPSIVGERGPELFVPDRPGTIIPNNQMAASGGVTQEFNFPMTFPTQLEAFVRNVAAPAGRDAAAQVMRASRGRI